MKPSFNWLLASIPVTVGLEHAGAPAPWVFFSAAVAIVPIARLIVRSTEHLSTYTGDAVGGLLTATFGNAPELIIAVVGCWRGTRAEARGAAGRRWR
jgi:Ca2+:H+ antiporter